jgi:hypothetical protein
VIQVYDRHGRPIDTATWEQKLADEEYRFVAQHWVRGWKVSTVWLGLDHNFGGGGPPLIFETMIFAPADVTVGRDNAVRRALPVPADLDQYQERYPTEAAAQAGHDRALAAVVAQLGDDASADIAGPLVDGSSDSTWDGTWDAEA